MDYTNSLGKRVGRLRDVRSVAERAQRNFMTSKIFVAPAVAVASVAGTDVCQ
jgi:hypothetical protein